MWKSASTLPLQTYLVHDPGWPQVINPSLNHFQKVISFLSFKYDMRCLSFVTCTGLFKMVSLNYSISYCHNHLCLQRRRHIIIVSFKENFITMKIPGFLPPFLWLFVRIFGSKINGTASRPNQLINRVSAPSPSAWYPVNCCGSARSKASLGFPAS